MSTNLRATYKRDHGICWLCGQRVPLAGHGPERATIDHARPSSKGGTYSVNNMRLAHAGCNNARGTLPVPDVLHDAWRKRRASRLAPSDDEAQPGVPRKEWMRLASECDRAARDRTASLAARAARASRATEQRQEQG
ncbi:HNH endonuclease [Patulibacter minatonensis]|uniref:HNH endonuclease n=1 Tax=Patulibacter minatonensis TaxID=298163 RepID=UPI000A018468|nr:HNH endonuclease signature motif containing protein [Patulibacter minatonensis]